MDKRFVGVARRHGIWQNTVDYWNAILQIKKRFEQKMGDSLYGVLPDIAQTTLLDLLE